MHSANAELGMAVNGDLNLSDTQQRHYGKVAAAIAYMTAHREQQPELIDVAEHVGMSPHHLQRVFSDWAGISPKKFLKTITLDAVKARLIASESVLNAAFEAGLSGPGRLHDLFVSVDAVTPGEFKSQGKGMTFHYGFHDSPFGECLIVASSRGLTGLSFVVQDRARALAEQRQGWGNAQWIESTELTQLYATQAFDSSSGHQPGLLLRGSPFRVKVWEALLRIPEGTVMSYGGLAAKLGTPKAARAVASAVANNLVGYVIPCHRVIRESGALASYRWGVERKVALLGLESLPIYAHDLETDGRPA